MHSTLQFLETQVKWVYTGKHTPPHYATEGSSGMDLSASIQHPIVLQPLERRLIPTGIFLLEMPSLLELQIRSKSGLSLNKGVCVHNAPATIDSDYVNVVNDLKKEVGVILWNTSEDRFTVNPGMKIAQGVFGLVLRAKQGMTKDTKKVRIGGYGSTGT